MKRIVALGFALLAMLIPVNAQIGPGAPTYALVVASCGHQAWSAGATQPLTQDTTGLLCVSS